MFKKLNFINMLVALFCSICFFPVFVGAALINPGFEDDFTGWTTGGNTSVVSGAKLSGVNFIPFSGNKMGALTLPAMTGSVLDNYIYQNMVIAENENYLNLYYNFWTYDEAPFDNPAFMVTINGMTKFSVSAGDIGDGTPGRLDYTGWQLYSIDISEYYAPDPRPATIRIAFHAGNTGDNQFPSGAFIDGLSITRTPQAVPVPIPLLLLGSGLIGLVGLKRRIR